MISNINRIEATRRLIDGQTGHELSRLSRVIVSPFIFLSPKPQTRKAEVEKANTQQRNYLSQRRDSSCANRLTFTSSQ